MNFQVFKLFPSTEVEEFVDKKVCRRARTHAGERKHPRRRNKKARDFTQPFIHKSKLLSTGSASQAIFNFDIN